MAAMDAATCREEISNCCFDETHCESGQEKARPDTEDKVNGQLIHKNYTLPAGYSLPKKSIQSSRDATKDIWESSVAGNQQCQTSTIDLLVFYEAISVVCSLSEDIVSKIAADLSRNGKPINNKTLTEKCILYEEVHGLFVENYQEGDEYKEIDGAAGVSVSNAATLTTTFQSLPSMAHTSQHPSLTSKYHHQFNSTAQKSPSTYSDNRNSDSRQRGSSSCQQPLLSLPIVNQDYQFTVSTQSCLNNVAEDVGEDSVDGHSFESNDGLDSWVGNGLSNHFVQVSDSTLENTDSPMLSQTLYGSGHNMSVSKPGQNMSVSKPGQNMLFNELSNEKSAVASLNTSVPLSRMQQNSISGSSQFTLAGSPIDGLSNGLSTPGSRKQLSKDSHYIVCDGADNEIIRGIIEPQKLRGAEITPDRKSSSLSGAEMVQISVSLLEKEHELLEKSRLCHSCHDKPREVTFLPCGHFINCGNCAEPIYTCPLCQKSILATVNTYLS